MARREPRCLARHLTQASQEGPRNCRAGYTQALDVALCYGWIDGQKAKFDDQWRLQRFTPRKPRSK
jgi:uncharacterized protein YdeI (YjbR/CyaY-like superfamily)